MAVNTTTLIADGVITSRYTPYHAARRGGPDGSDPVGTLSVNAQATGAAGGGTVIVGISMNRETFGFPLLWVPTMISIADNLATAEDVDLAYSGGRMETAQQQVVTMVQFAENAGAASQYGVSFEGGEATLIITATWQTNTDTKTYHLHVFGPVYDLQVIAARGRISDIMAGLR